MARFRSLLCVAAVAAVSGPRVVSGLVKTASGATFKKLKGGACVGSVAQSTNEGSAFKLYTCKGRCGDSPACMAYDYFRRDQVVTCRLFSSAVTSTNPSFVAQCYVLVSRPTATTTTQPTEAATTTTRITTTVTDTTTSSTTSTTTSGRNGTACRNDFEAFCTLPELGLLLQGASPKCASYLQFFLMQSEASRTPSDQLHCACFLELDATMAAATTCKPSTDLPPVADQYGACQAQFPDFLRPDHGGPGPTNLNDLATQLDSLSSELKRMQVDLSTQLDDNHRSITNHVTSTCRDN